MNVRVCDAGGPIKAGDRVYHIGRIFSTVPACKCHIIALQDVNFIDWPLDHIPVFVIESICDPRLEPLILDNLDLDT